MHVSIVLYSVAIAFCIVVVGIAVAYVLHILGVIVIPEQSRKVVNRLAVACVALAAAILASFEINDNLIDPIEIGERNEVLSKQLDTVDREVVQLQENLIQESGPLSSIEFFIHVRDEANREDELEKIEQALKSAGAIVYDTEKLGFGPSTDQVRYFFDADEEIATKAAEITGLEPVHVKGFESSAKTKRLEIWLTK